jgi:CBS domain-containing protein
MRGLQQTHKTTVHVENHTHSFDRSALGLFNLSGLSSVASTHGVASIADGGSNFAERQEQTQMNTRQPSLVERRMSFMPCTVEPSDSVAHARALLDERGIKHLPVMSNERLVGIVSTHDLEARTFSDKRPALAKILEAHPDRVKINSVMTRDVRIVTPSDNLAYAAQLMRSKHIGALPVLEHERLAGIISRSDLLDALVPGVKTKANMVGRKSRRTIRGSNPVRRSSPMQRAADGVDLHPASLRSLGSSPGTV